VVGACVKQIKALYKGVWEGEMWWYVYGQKVWCVVCGVCVQKVAAVGNCGVQVWGGRCVWCTGWCGEGR